MWSEIIYKVYGKQRTKLINGIVARPSNSYLIFNELFSVIIATEVSDSPFTTI